MNALRHPGVGIKLSLRLLLVVLVGLSVNLVSSALDKDARLSSLWTALGWRKLLIALALALMIYDAWTDFQAERQKVSFSQELRTELNRRARAAWEEILVRLFRLSVDLTLLPKDGGAINLHYFRSESLEGRLILRKVRSVGYDREGLPHNYTLDYADPTKDNLVICESFNADAMIYRVLPGNIIETYGPDLRSKVDPQIAWVLACPVHRDDLRPAGVICAFGSREIFKDKTSEVIFEQSMWGLAEVISILERLQKE